MSAQAIEGLGADVVFDPTSIFKGDLLTDPHPDKNFRQAVMTVIRFFRDFTPFAGEEDMLIGVQLQIARISKAPDLLAYGWSGEVHMIGNVDGTDMLIFLAKDENCFEIPSLQF